MKRILNYLNGLQFDQKTEAIIHGDFSMKILQQKSKEFQNLEQKEKIIHISKLNERIKQITKPFKALSVLALVDSFMKRGLLACLPHMEFKELKESMHVEDVILINIFKYYHYFLKMNNCSYQIRQTLKQKDELSLAEHFCRINIVKILQFFKIQFVFTHGWKRLAKHRLLLGQIIQSILQRFAQDLEIITVFVKNNQDLLKQKTFTHPLMKQIYLVYQKLIFINKSLSKIEKIGRMAHCQQNFTTYQLKIESNKEIELNILSKKREFKVEVSVKAEVDQIENVKEVQFEELEVPNSESFVLLNEIQQLN